MYQLVESLRIENKELQNIDLHNERINSAGKIILDWKENFDLTKHILIPSTLTNQRYKCRVETNGIHVNVSITEYHQRKVETLKIVIQNDIDYHFKTTNRNALNEAYNLRGNCDDIIIVKNGFVTDSWAANILLFDGDRWITPNTPLLKGIQREFLLSEKIIVERTVTIDDFFNFQQLKLVNAMITFDQSPSIEITKNVFR